MSLKDLLDLMFDPRFFNYVVLTLYILNSLRWALHGSWGDALYWCAAFQITFAVTFGLKR